MSSKAFNSRQVIYFFALIFLFSASFSQYLLDHWWSEHSYVLPVSYNEFIEPESLTGLSATIASFGQKDFLADLYWLELIQYYGGGDPNGQYRKLPDLYNTITDLSPGYSAAYQSGMLILPSEGYVSQAIALGNKGEKNLPDDWEMPYYQGIVYDIYMKDYVAAARDFTKASKIPGAPANTVYFAALYYNEANEPQTSLALFETVYATTTDSYLKDRAGKYIQQLQIIFALDNAISQYKTSYGSLPNSLQDLVDKKIISSVPVSPLGFSFVYNPMTGLVQVGK